MMILRPCSASYRSARASTFTDSVPEHTSPQPGTPQRGRRQAGILWFVGAALIPVAAALFLVVSPAIRSIQPSPEDVEEPVAFEETPEEPLPDSLVEVLERTERARSMVRADEAFLLAQRSEAKASRAFLSIDLRDSLAVLTIQGVPVRKSKILAVDRSGLFEASAPLSALLTEFETPFTLIGASASIPKNPVRVVEAPKDTAEARQRPIEAFVPEERYVYADLHFDRHVTVRMTPPDDEGDWKQVFRSKFERRRGDVAHTFYRFFEPDSTPPVRWIDLEMRSDDIRAIYRALPDDGKMAIRW